MPTPTCRTCNTKFPGKDICKTCGCDPNATPSLASRIERVTTAMRMIASQAARSGMLTPEYRAYERRARRARVRSITTTTKRRKHGRSV